MRFVINKLSEHWNNPYRGAGIIFVTRSADGTPEVFAGRRRRPPSAGRWVLVGGELDPIEDGSYFDCACREASEETCNHLPLDEHLRQWLPSDFSADTVEKRTLKLHWYEWQTFLVPLKERPPQDVWPCKNAEFLFEFSEAQWFPLSELLKLRLSWLLRFDLWRFRNSPATSLSPAASKAVSSCGC